MWIFSLANNNLFATLCYFECANDYYYVTLFVDERFHPL